jgi:hypothetical protein
MIKGLIAALAVLLGLSITSLVVAMNATSANHSQQASISRLTAKAASQENEISALQSSVAGLIASVQNPSNPLAAYSQICNQDFTNSSTGVTQLYYFPCTNSVIPTTGN